MATRYRLGTGYAYSAQDVDDEGLPEIVILPPDAEGCEGIADVYQSTARRGWVDGVKVVWVDTPVGAFAQMEHMMESEES